MEASIELARAMYIQIGNSSLRRISQIVGRGNRTPMRTYLWTKTLIWVNKWLKSLYTVPLWHVEWYALRKVFMASHDRPIKRAAGELVSLKRVIGALKESLKPVSRGPGPIKHIKRKNVDNHLGMIGDVNTMLQDIVKDTVGLERAMRQGLVCTV